MVLQHHVLFCARNAPLGSLLFVCCPDNGSAAGILIELVVLLGMCHLVTRAQHRVAAALVVLSWLSSILFSDLFLQRTCLVKARLYRPVTRLWHRAFYSPKRLCLKGFLLGPNAMGGLDRASAGHGSSRNPRGSLQSLVPWASRAGSSAQNPKMPKLPLSLP